jgi:hypothetical protein
MALCSTANSPEQSEWVTEGNKLFHSDFFHFGTLVLTVLWLALEVHFQRTEPDRHGPVGSASRS